MKVIGIVTLALVITIGTVSLIRAESTADEVARKAFKLIISQTDLDKDGKLSLAECKTMYRDAAAGERNCTFWDANHDGTITEDEYVSKATTSMRYKE